MNIFITDSVVWFSILANYVLEASFGLVYKPNVNDSNMSGDLLVRLLLILRPCSCVVRCQLMLMKLVDLELMLDGVHLFVLYK